MPLKVQTILYEVMTVRKLDIRIRILIRAHKKSGLFDIEDNQENWSLWAGM